MGASLVDVFAVFAQCFSMNIGRAKHLSLGTACVCRAFGVFQTTEDVVPQEVSTNLNVFNVSLLVARNPGSSWSQPVQSPMALHRLFLVEFACFSIARGVLERPGASRKTHLTVCVAPNSIDVFHA